MIHGFAAGGDAGILPFAWLPIFSAFDFMKPNASRFLRLAVVVPALLGLSASAAVRPWAVVGSGVAFEAD